MNRKVITLLLIVGSFCLLFIFYNLNRGYYDVSYYNVDLTSDVDELVFGVDDVRTVDVHIKNNSRKILSSQNNVYMSYHLLDQNGNMLEFEMPRFDLPTINPYNSGNVSIQIERPETPGTYQVEIDLLEEGVNWFKNKGSKTLVLRIIV